MSDPDAEAELVAAWRTLSRAVRGAVGPDVLAAAHADRRGLEREVETAELALVWIRALAAACRDRLDTEDLAGGRSGARGGGGCGGASSGLRPAG